MKIRFDEIIPSLITLAIALLIMYNTTSGILGIIFLIIAVIAVYTIINSFDEKQPKKVRFAIVTEIEKAAKNINEFFEVINKSSIIIVSIAIVLLLLFSMSKISDTYSNWKCEKDKTCQQEKVTVEATYSENTQGIACIVDVTPIQTLPNCTPNGSCGGGGRTETISMKFDNYADALAYSQIENKRIIECYR